ncbi:MAG TPA: four helix bundle protein [Patescibacteria group bacterium]|nr:four helix bundle protein [Patescibacteria group bacterium]
MQDYHNLLAWKKALEFVKLVYRLTKLFPADELYGLVSQLRRASVSVLANLVEGRGKPTDKDFVRFLYITTGSLNECQCYFELALELGYIDKKQFDFIYNKSKEVGYLVFQLIKSIK